MCVCVCMGDESPVLIFRKHGVAEGILTVCACGVVLRAVCVCACVCAYLCLFVLCANVRVCMRLCVYVYAGERVRVRACGREGVGT